MLIEDNHYIFIVCVSYEDFIKDSKKLDEFVSKFDQKGFKTIYVVNKVIISYN